MIMYRCDRCGEVVDKTVTISTSIPKTENPLSIPNESEGRFFDMWASALMSMPKTIKIELCEDCLKVLVRWMTHPENFLMKYEELMSQKKSSKVKGFTVDRSFVDGDCHETSA